MITIVNGRRRQGKTTLAYYLSLEKPTRVIFDPRRQFDTTSFRLDDGIGLYDAMDEESEVLIQPTSDVKGTFRNIAQDFRDWTVDNPDEPAVLLVDESRFLDTPNQNYEAFEQTIRFSEGEIVDVLMTSHRPGDISVDIRAISDYYCIFRTTQEHDLKVITQRCGDEVAEIVSNLKDKEFLVWNDGTATFHTVDEPHKWFVDIHLRNEVKYKPK
jgi:hypothetical protein